MRRSILKALVLSLVSILFLTSSTFAETKAVEEKPSATLTLSGGSAALGVGFQWGTGTLNFNGKSYDIKYNGLSVGEVGGSGKNISGEVFGLTDIKDFEGRYAALKTSAAVAAGGEVSTMANEKGVKINLHGVERGIKLSFGAEGLKFSLADEAAKKNS